MNFASFRNARVVRSSWLEEGGRRLDCNPYMSGALEARDALKLLKAPKEKLKDVTAGIFHAGREGRHWVDSPEYGVPFLGSSDILSADLSTLPLMSKKQIKRNPHFTLGEKWTLITRSGTIGRMAYVRPDMAGLACSEHVLRVVPDESRIPPGYLYAFLSSKFGVPLVLSGTYGAIIQHIEPHHIADLPVPRFDSLVEERIHGLVTVAAERRAAATKNLAEAQQLLREAIGLPEQPTTDAGRLTQVVRCSDIEATMRMEGFFYNPRAARVEKWARSFNANCADLGSIANVHDVPPFKHIYVEPGHGVPFFTSGELFDLDRSASKFLSKSRTLNLHRYMLERGWVLLARSGQLGGIIGRPQYADSALDGASTSDHVIRLVPQGIPGGYLFAYLYNIQIGYPLITRTMTGHSIPALWPSQLKSLPVVLATPPEMAAISALVVAAFEERVQATELERQAREIVEDAIGEGAA